MQVKVKVFEDYEIFGDEIYPVGCYQYKRLNSNDVRNALRLFLKIKTNKDALNFARKYGLLNGYDLWTWWYFSEEDWFSTMITLASKNLEYFSYENGIAGRIVENKNRQIGKYDYQRIKKALEKTKTIDDITSILSPIRFKLFIYGKIESLYRDTYKKMFAFLSDMTKDYNNGIPFMLPMCDCFFYFQDNGLAVTKDEKFKTKDIYIDYVLYFLQRLYEKNKTTMSLDYFYNCIGENVGLKGKNRNSWISYQSKLLNYARDAKVLTDGNVSKQEQLEDLLLKNKGFRKRITLEYSYKKKKQNYILEPELVFDSLYDALEWFIVSAGDMIKICKYCNKPFLTSREDAKYCSDNCRSKAKYHRHKKIKHISKK